MQIGGPDSGLPSASHAGALTTRAHAVHAAVLCCALHAGMQALPELGAQVQQGEGGEMSEALPASAAKGKSKAAKQQQQQQETAVGSAGRHAHSGAKNLPSVRDMFIELGQLQPEGCFDAHLSLLLEKALPELQPRAAFLAALFATPDEATTTQATLHTPAALATSTPTATHSTPIAHTAISSAPPAARAAALRLYATSITHTTTTPKQQQQHQQQTVSITLYYLPHLLSAAACPHPTVRACAVYALHAAASALQHSAAQHAGTGDDESVTAAAALSPLLGSLLRHATLVTADAEAVVVLLRNTFAGVSAESSAQPSAAAVVTATAAQVCVCVSLGAVQV